jgi:hypothetical protein
VNTHNSANDYIHRRVASLMASRVPRHSSQSDSSRLSRSSSSLPQYRNRHNIIVTPETTTQVPHPPKDPLPVLRTPKSLREFRRSLSPKKRAQSMSERTKPNEGGNDLQPLVSRSRSTVLPFSGSSVQFWTPTTPDYASIRLQDLRQHFARDREYEEKVAGSSTRGVRSLLHLSWKRGIFRILEKSWGNKSWKPKPEILDGALVLPHMSYYSSSIIACMLCFLSLLIVLCLLPYFYTTEGAKGAERKEEKRLLTPPSE